MNRIGSAFDRSGVSGWDCELGLRLIDTVADLGVHEIDRLGMS